MGMPITIEITDNAKEADLNKIFNYFRRVDEQYSPYKPSSELSKVNAGLPRTQWSPEFVEIIDLCEQTTRLTDGYFNAEYAGKLDPSGLVKGWAIQHAAEQLVDADFVNFYIEAGGDIQAHGNYKPGTAWQIGIRNPFNIEEIIKVVNIQDQGIATSGTYIRGQHIYDPRHGFSDVRHIKSLTVIGPNIYEADRFATAAFAMGESGIAFIEGLPGFEGYQIDDNQIATLTSGFENYVSAAD